MRVKIPLLEEAFTGHFTNHHRFLLRTMLARIDQASADIAAVETQIEERSPLSLRRSSGSMRSPASASPPRT